MGRYRQHSAEFKVQVVREVTEGGKTPAQACREHDISERLLLRWRKAYQARGASAFTVRDEPDQPALARRVAELARLCGQLTLENAVLNKGLATARSRRATR